MFEESLLGSGWLYFEFDDLKLFHDIMWEQVDIVLLAMPEDMLKEIFFNKVFGIVWDLFEYLID